MSETSKRILLISSVTLVFFAIYYSLDIIFYLKNNITKLYKKITNKFIYPIKFDNKSVSSITSKVIDKCIKKENTGESNKIKGEIIKTDEFVNKKLKEGTIANDRIIVEKEIPILENKVPLPKNYIRGFFEDKGSNQQRKIVYGEGIVWDTENWSAEEPPKKLNAFGKAVMENGVDFQGIFKDGQLQGPSKISDNGKIVMEGCFDEDPLKPNKLVFRGKYHSPSGEIFEGEMLDHQLVGMGKITLADRTVKEGQFKKNQLSGQGSMTFPDGSFFSGRFKNDILDGQGVASYADGSIYEGTFMKGKLNGQGTIVVPQEKICEGTFVNDYLNGFGKIIFANGETHEGHFENDILNGHGKITNTQQICVGEFIDCKLNGFAVIEYRDGRLLRGNFNNNIFTGP